MQVEEVAVEQDAAAVPDVTCRAVVQANHVLASGLDPSFRVRASALPEFDSGLLHAVKINMSSVVGRVPTRKKICCVLSGVGEGSNVM